MRRPNKNPNRLLVGGTALTLLLILVACGSRTTPAPASTPAPAMSTIVVPAPIKSVVGIDVGFTNPPGSSLILVSRLRNSCESFHEYSLAHDGDIFRVEVTNLRQVVPDLECPMQYETVTTRISLAGDFQAGRTYTVMVNGESHSVLAVAPTAYIQTSQYVWRGTSQFAQEKYAKAVWNRITSSELEGFSPSYTLTEKTATCSYSKDNQDQFLRKDGRFICIGYYLEIEKSVESTVKVNSFEKLKEIFASVDSAVEAVSFVAVTANDLISEGGGDILVGHTLPIDDGYLVHVMRNHTFGCGPHLPTGAIYKVTRSGDIDFIAYEEEQPVSDDDIVLCID